MHKIRYHCLEEMDLMSEGEGKWWYICKICQTAEFSPDPNRETTPEERPRKNFKEYGNHTIIGKV